MIAGFSIAAPVGPIGVLCIQRTLKEGRLAGWIHRLSGILIAGFGVDQLVRLIASRP